MERLDDNPLYNLAEFPEFDRIRPEHAVPALRAHIANAEKAVAALEAGCEPTWDGRVDALRSATHPLWRAWGVVSHLISVCNSKQWREAEETLLPEVIAFSIRVSQSDPLYKSLRALRDSPEFDSLDAGRKRVVENSLRDARNSGVGLEAGAREEFNACIEKLSKLGMKFTNNLLDATKAFSIMLCDRTETDGLPPTLLEACAQSAREAGEAGASAEDGPWRVTLEHAVYGPFMQYSERRDLREKLYRANVTRASEGETDNCSIIVDILALRRKLAIMVGYEDYAGMSLASKMAEKADAVYDMIDMIGDAAMPKAREEMQTLLEFAHARGFNEARLSNWDQAYWSRRQVEELYGYSPENLRPYFQFAKVLDGLFELAGKLAGIKVESADGIAPVWHKDVRFFRVLGDDRETIAWLYLDPYSRPESKRGGAWMNDLQTRGKMPDGTVKLPIALIVCNQAFPAGGKPSCMTPGEINTLFHEFGHVTQHVLTKVDIPQASGINNIEWDAVEVASQFLENWSMRPEVLKALSSHVDTGAKLDDAILERIHNSEKHMAATQTARQLSFALMDMDLHTKYPSDEFKTPGDAAKAATDRFAVTPPLPEDRFLCSFSHIFAGGYAAGYYSYMWSDVLAADAFGAFEEAGLDNPGSIASLGRRYADTILALGGSRKPMEVFKAFRGREPDPTALLRQKGLA